MPLFVYKRNGTFHIRDERGNHWTLRRATWGRDVRELSDGSPIDPAGEILLREPTLFLRAERRHRRGGGPAMARFQAPQASSWTVHGAAHGVMNLLTQEGSWAWYTGRGAIKRQGGRVHHGYVPRRTHTAAMNAATMFEVGAVLSATDYARRGHGAYWTRGHAAIRYEWCHLVGHGLGGADATANLVAATCHQNTEQLILECVLYGYRMEGFDVEVEAKIARGTQHLAESIWYKVLLAGNVVYSRTMDCRRVTRPSWDEYRSVAADLRTRLNEALEARYEADDDLRYEEWEHIEENVGLVGGDDGSGDLWRSLLR